MATDSKRLQLALQGEKRTRADQRTFSVRAMGRKPTFQTAQVDVIRDFAKRLVSEHGSQTKLAEALGVSQGALSQFLLGKTGPSVNLVRDMTALAGTTPGALLQDASLDRDLPSVKDPETLAKEILVPLSEEVRRARAAFAALCDEANTHRLTYAVKAFLPVVEAARSAAQDAASKARATLTLKIEELEDELGSLDAPHEELREEIQRLRTVEQEFFLEAIGNL